MNIEQSTNRVNISDEQLETETVEDMLNRKIQFAREAVEKLCILKAKAETVGIHKMPASFLRAVVWS